MSAVRGEATVAGGTRVRPEVATTRSGRLRRGVREFGLALIMAGVVVLLFVAYELWGTAIAEAHSQAKLKHEFNAAVEAARPGVKSGGDTPVVGGTAPGGLTPAAAGQPAAGAVDHLVIPRIHLDVYVVQGVSLDDLRQGPGHYPQTVFPGQVGNAAIAGHRTTYGAPFFSLNSLAVGDDILITDTAGRNFTFQVSAPPRAVSPWDVAVLDPTPSAELTLTTCNPRYSDTSRLIVVAHLRGKPLPAPAHTPSSAIAAASADNNLGRGDRGAWFPALAFAALALLLWVGVRIVVHRTRRWLRAGALIAGIAICLVPLWFAFENAARILPPNI
jgi:sortase A